MIAHSMGGLVVQRARFASHRDFAFRAVAGASDQFVPAESSLAPFDKAGTSTVPGNHLTMVKPESADDLPVRIVVNTLTRAPGGADAPERAEFRRTVNELLPQKAGLDQRRLALDVLRGARPDQYDARGTLADRRRRVLQRRNGEDDRRRGTEGVRGGGDVALHAEALALRDRGGGVPVPRRAREGAGEISRGEGGRFVRARL